ncbi:MAG: hypothetical protein ACE5HW_01270 [Candidatus Methanofastidiosia archaeon]
MIKRVAIFALLILFQQNISSQEELNILNLNQKLIIDSQGDVHAIYNVTFKASDPVEKFIFYFYYTSAAYTKNVKAKDKNGDLRVDFFTNPEIKDITILAVEFPPTEPGRTYSFTLEYDLWDAVEILEREATYRFFTGFPYPIERLEISVILPPNSHLVNFAPANGTKISHDEREGVRWIILTHPAEKIINPSIFFIFLTREEALELLEEAKVLYNAKNYELSQKKFQRAKEIFVGLSDNKGIEETEIYLRKLESVFAARELLDESSKLFDSEDYKNALSKLEEALNIYEELGLESEKAQTLEMQLKLRDYIHAESEIEEGERLSENGDYKSAIVHFENARKIFEKFEDSEKIEEVKVKIDLVRQKLAHEREEKLYKIRVVGIILVFLFVIFVLLKRRYVFELPSKPEKKKLEKDLQPCNFCGRLIAENALVCPFCEEATDTTKEDLEARKREITKTLDDLEKSFLSKEISEKEYKKLKDKWVNQLVEIEDKIISLELRKKEG